MTGQRLGHYQISAQLGAGGMGEVYRARDTKLGRDVAIKVLPRSFAAEQERLGRFEQEARTLATLNHPNIMVVFDTGVHDGSPYLVSELLEGQTLRDALKPGALTLRRALDYAAQLANGLAAAHDKGVVHRDLKPENIFITHDGRVKILDFGVAKLVQNSGPKGDSVTLAPSAATLHHKTEPGMVLGTPGYMSPEQVRGEPAEERSDIFSFGAILYEMLCGQRAFQGQTGVEVMNAIINSEPQDLAERVPNVPPALERVVRRCLEKRPEKRFQTAADLAFAMENIDSTGGSMLGGQRVEAKPRLGVGRLLPWAIALGLAVYAYVLVRSPAVPPAGTDTRPLSPLRKIELPLPPLASGLAIAPDGRKLVYMTAEGLWLRWLDRVAPPVLLAAPRVARGSRLSAPFWSPQSDDVGYFEGPQMYRVSVTGGSPRSICTMVGGIFTSGGGAWLANDRIVFTTGISAFYEVSANGGTPTLALALAEDELDFHRPSALPGGRGVLFVVRRKTGDPPHDTIAVWSPPGQKKVLQRTPGNALVGPVHAPSGHVVYGVGDPADSVWAFPFSHEKLERTGEAFRVADDGSEPSVAGDGTLAYWPRSSSRFVSRQLVWLDRSGKIVGRIGSPMLSLDGARLSPDGQRIVAVASIGASGGSRNVWVFETASGSAVPLTRTPENETNPFWYPDGRKVLYATQPTAQAGATVRAKAVDGFGAEEEIAPGFARELSRSGRYLIIQVLGNPIPGSTPAVARNSVWGYLDLSPDSDRKLQLFPRELNALNVALSPDDRLMAYSSSETGHGEIFMVSFPDFGNKTRVSRTGGDRMQWGPDGSELFWLSLSDRREFWSAGIKRDAGLQAGEPAKVFDVPESVRFYPRDNGFQVASDGQRFLMLENVSAAGGGPTTQQQQDSPAMLVQNWFEEFRGK